jgi:hypothetical protein
VNDFHSWLVHLPHHVATWPPACCPCGVGYDVGQSVSVRCGRLIIRVVLLPGTLSHYSFGVAMALVRLLYMC